MNTQHEIPVIGDLKSILYLLDLLWSTPRDVSGWCRVSKVLLVWKRHVSLLVISILKLHCTY